MKKGPIMNLGIDLKMTREERKEARLSDLREQLFSARIYMYPEVLYLYAQLAAALSGLATLLLMVYLSQLIVPLSFLFLFPAFGVMIIFIWIAIALTAVYGAFTAILLLPKIEAGTRAGKIEMSLYNTVTYIYTLHHGGESMYQIIKSLSSHADFYGESAAEFKQVISDCDFASMDLYSSILRLSETTPSNKFRFFLTGLTSALKTIGTAEDYLRTKIFELREEQRVNQKVYLNTLGVIAEMYITLFVAGPLFLIIVVMVMGMLSSAHPAILAVIIYVMLPFGTAIFLLLLDMISENNLPGVTGVRAQTRIRYPEVKVIQTDSDESELYQKVAKYEEGSVWRDFKADPMDYMNKHPAVVLFFSVPIALIFFLVMYSTFVTVEFTPWTMIEWLTAVEDIVLVAILMVMISYVLFYRVGFRKMLRVEEAIPEFADQMTSSIRHNMIIPQAVSLMANEGKSDILDELQIMDRDFQWGESTHSVLQKFSERVKIPAVDRLVILISEAERFTNRLSEVFEIIAGDSKNTMALKNERRGDMKLYVTVTYMAFFVYVFVMAILVVQFLPIMAGSGEGMSMIGSGGGGGFDIDLYNRMIYHSMVIHGFCSGLVAGMMGEGTAKAGLKHSCLMMAVSIITFVVIKIVFIGELSLPTM